ncbi:MAG TPA: thioesterase [Vicinamibacteria bacterium]
MKEPEPGATGEVALVVGEDDLASALSTSHHDAFPAVFATARMVAFMELAAARVLQPLLAPGELSVGVSIETSHSAATPPGATVTARARYLGAEGKQYLFEVAAFDDAGEIGRGTHRRAIVTVERLLAGAERRRPR